LIPNTAGAVVESPIGYLSGVAPTLGITFNLITAVLQGYFLFKLKNKIRVVFLPNFCLYFTKFKYITMSFLGRVY
jgi:hypothetical protein